MQNSCRDVFLEFFTTNTPDPHHWTLNTCFGAFLPVWVHLEPFRCYTKLEAKQDNLVQLIQQFVPRCFVRIFRNERSRSTPLDPKLMFWCVFFYVGAFGTILLLHETCCKTHQTGPKTHVFVHFFSIWVHFGPFRYFTKLGAKWANPVQLMQKFMPRCLLTIFRNKCSRSTPLEPKLMFWCVSFYVGAFETIWL